MRLLLIDNFDSFVFNLYQYFLELGCVVMVVRNNELGLEQIRGKNFDAIVISPGPGHPGNDADFGVCAKVIKELSPSVPILGVCLGHQGIINVFGGKVVRAKKPMHGKTSVVSHNGKDIFEGVKNPLTVMRYHSLVGEKSSMPSCLEVTAKSVDDGEIMAVRHKDFLVFGVQFHPESIMTDDGKIILRNFCKIAGASA